MLTGESNMVEYPVKGDFEYKRELAHQLIKRFGVTAARQTCIQNKWDEVLQAVNLVRTHSQSVYPALNYNFVEMSCRNMKL